jgi:hypothetical protein
MPWPIYFTYFTLLCQLGLMFLGDTPLRLPLRIATYGASLVLLYCWPPKYPAHPALKLLKWVPIIMVIGILHPEHNTLLACAGQLALYIAVYAPLAWVAGCRPSWPTFERLVIVLWLFNFASAGAGVLQVYFPGEFRGATSGIIQSRSAFQSGEGQVVLADGTRILRPFGLTDTPGGAANGGLNAIILGTGIFLAKPRLFWRLAAISGMLVGLFAIFLSQVRVGLVMAGVCTLVMLVMLGRRRQWGQVVGISTVLGIVVMLGITWAFAVGGKQTIERFATLTSSDPTDVYSQNRGFFMQELVNTDIPRYPLGAGLGRWGMMNFYFGTDTNHLYSEIMWTSWLYDGGLPLLILYAVAVGVALWVSWKLAALENRSLGLWASVIFSYNVAALAGTFVFPLFVVQGGLEFWLINACLYAAYVAMLRGPALVG